MANLFRKEGLQCNEKGVRHVIDVSILFYESSIILLYKLLSLQKIKYLIIMENTVLERNYNEIISYIEKYKNNVSQTNAKEVIDSFKEEWVNSIDEMFIGEKYG